MTYAEQINITKEKSQADVDGWILSLFNGTFSTELFIQHPAEIGQENSRLNSLID